MVAVVLAEAWMGICSGGCVSLLVATVGSMTVVSVYGGYTGGREVLCTCEKMKSIWKRGRGLRVSEVSDEIWNRADGCLVIGCAPAAVSRGECQ
ncbi:hypothetical protein EJ04DRAFT_515770 [Polyplosphaeria fusca]|uniref:Uncharacterized protein n=1 Tax=Polyplosphaeria fusca TaxID=682080 RepID=A0A9P4QQI7_9PLEO|nr:hypothetical protein EJ04DRAFT_515770 [Polyplosphaeria fusca]